MKFAFIFSLAVLIFPAVSFAQTSNANFLQIIAILQEQIRILQQQVNALILSLGLSAQTPVAPEIKVNPEPKFDLRIDGSDGPITIKKGEGATLSWNLSQHIWSYCNKFLGWDGGFKPVNGTEVISSINSNTTFKAICYLDSKTFEDSVSVRIAEPEVLEPMPKVAEQPSTQVASSTFFATPEGGIGSCSLEATPKFVTLGKDAIETTWVIDSAPRQAFFYWRGKDNGVDIGRVYGGKTQRIRIFDYPSVPAKYERYVEMVLDPYHIIGDTFVSGCTTNTAIFEVKQ